MSTAEEWTLEGFCSHFEFVHKEMPDHAFAWVLGAGASKASGIPTGGDLVGRWLRELHERLDTAKQPFEAWASEKNLGIKGFELENAASFYPRIYERRYRNHPEEGYACLEDLMSGKDPSPGYSILAKVMEKERHKVVITTNFDNLVADALSIYTDTFPFVCGHESLTGFVRTAMRRPLVCKIHRDLLLGPKNEPRGLKRLHEAWAGALRPLLGQYTPLFIGYGGNDDSLMDLLESLDPGEIKGQMIWCYYEGGQPSDRIKELVAQHRGALVPVPDFDLLMVLLGAVMGIEPLDAVIEQRAKERTAKYRERILALDTTEHSAVATALRSTLERAGGWWAWELKAGLETNLAKREAIYRQGIEQFPRSPELHGNFANFMADMRKDFDEAERLYRRALELDPNDADYAGNFAAFMADVRKKFDEAEWLYRKALKLDPNHAASIGNFATFMANVRKNFDEAERLYRKALELNPDDADDLGNFATFMAWVRKNSDEAERMYQKALDLNPTHADNTGSFAGFLVAHDRIDEALPLLQRAWELRASGADQLPAEIGLYWGIAERCAGGDDTRSVGRIKTLLVGGFTRIRWSFDAILEFAKTKLSADDYALYSAVAAAILDAEQVTKLNDFERWRAVAPVPLESE